MTPSKKLRYYDSVKIERFTAIHVSQSECYAVVVKVEGVHIIIWCCSSYPLASIQNALRYEQLPDGRHYLEEYSRAFLLFIYFSYDFCTDCFPLSLLPASLPSNIWRAYPISYFIAAFNIYLPSAFFHSTPYAWRFYLRLFYPPFSATRSRTIYAPLNCQFMDKGASKYAAEIGRRTYWVIVLKRLFIPSFRTQWLKALLPFCECVVGYTNWRAW